MDGTAEGPAGLYQGLLGTAWLDLDATVRRAHPGEGVATGRLTFRYGTGFAVRILRLALRFQSPGAHDIRLVVTRRRDTETWARTLGRRTLVSTQRRLPDGRLAERFGIVELRFRLRVREGALTYLQVGTAVTLGRICIPLPGGIAARVEGREERGDDGDSSHVRIAISAPLVGFVMSYEGSIRMETVR